MQQMPTHALLINASHATNGNWDASDNKVLDALREIMMAPHFLQRQFLIGHRARAVVCTQTVQ